VRQLLQHGRKAGRLIHRFIIVGKLPPCVPQISLVSSFKTVWSYSLGMSVLWAGYLSRYSDWLRVRRSGIESRWGRNFPHLSRPALGPTQPPVQWVPWSFLGVKSGRGVNLTPHSLLVPWSRKSRAISLLPLWTVRPVQSLSTCTRIHFIRA
jgi:hypothetical protein